MVTHFAQIGFYKLTTLRTETFTHSNFYAQTFLHREICAQKKSTQMPLQTEVFTHRKMYLHTYALYKDVFSRVHKGTYAFLHTQPFPQRSLCAEQFFTHVFLKHLTQKNLYTENAHISFYRPTFLHAKILPEQFLLHNKIFFAQKPLRTKKICTTIFTDRWFLHRKFSAKKSCAQKVLSTTFFT